jgi:hypothetical protein
LVQTRVLHDLRRTPPSLMSRAGVRPNIAERASATSCKASRAFTIDHCYRDETTDVLAPLATLINGIVQPRENVVPIRQSLKRETT